VITWAFSTQDVRRVADMYVVYTVQDQYRCVTEIVPDRGFVYTQDDTTVAFYARKQQCDALLFEVLQVALHNF
jgi:hypothetical protein